MGRDLIKRYSIEKMNLKNISQFLRDVYRSGKFREFVSFIIWETRHRLGLFPRDRYLKFNEREPLELRKPDSLDSAFDQNLENLFRDYGMKAVKSAHKWKRLFIGNTGEIFGTQGHDSRELYKSVDNNATVDHIYTFPDKIKSIFISSQNNIFVAAGGAVFRGELNRQDFEKVFELSSTVSFFRHNYAMTETAGGVLVIGEYGNIWENGSWRAIANLYVSSDGGRIWKKSDFLIKKGINKHVHIVRYSQNLNRLFLTDGDNKKKLWISAPLSTTLQDEDFSWKPITRVHIQTGGYTSIAESNGKVMFGTDYQGGTNFIIETQDGKKYTKKIVPDPYRRSPIHSLVPRQTENGNEIWANLPISMGKSRSLLMFTKDGGKSWNKLVDYDSRVHSVSLLSASKLPVDDIYLAFKDLRNNDRTVYRISN